MTDIYLENRILSIESAISKLSHAVQTLAQKIDYLEKTSAKTPEAYTETKIDNIMQLIYARAGGMLDPITKLSDDELAKLRARMQSEQHALELKQENIKFADTLMSQPR